MTTVKNVEAYSRLVGFCTGYGGKYQPGHPNLQLDALVANLDNARSAIERANFYKNLYDETVNRRKQAFASIGTLASHMVRTMKNADASQETLNDARFLVRNLTGKTASNRQAIPSAQAEGVIVRRSNLQMAYVSKANWFSKLVQTVEHQPRYTTYVEALTKASLQEKVRQLESLNNQVITAYVEWSNARMERDKVLYVNPNSLATTFTKVKDEVRTLFGTGSKEFAQVRSLKITKTTG